MHDRPLLDERLWTAWRVFGPVVFILTKFGDLDGMQVNWLWAAKLRDSREI